MTKLRARGALCREATGEGADFVAAADVDDRALEDRVDREAIDHGLDLAIVKRAAIAREEIVDRGTIFEVAFAHSLSPSPGLSGPSPRLCWLHIPRGSGDAGVRSLRQALAALVLCTRSNAAAGRPASRQLHLISLHRLRTASPIRVTISLSIAGGVAKFSRANPT